MQFNSPEFAVFLFVVLVFYYQFKQVAQNRLLLFASYVFYGWWDWRYLGLILLSTVVDYACGLWIGSSGTEKRRKTFLLVSVVFNLSVLGGFKYFGFFVESLQQLTDSFGIQFPDYAIHVVLPVGISFYTFQTMSYTFDVYRRRLKPTHNFFDFALYVSFFPQLVAGPIERAVHLLPQLTSERTVLSSDWSIGGWLIYWGLFKKVVVADNLAKIVDPAFADPGSLDFFSVMLALYAFAWQIYCDFSGYTDIARGCARLLGIDLCLNFDLPYWATNPSEFWQRWHISLSAWLKDYLYVSLGGNRRGRLLTYRNLMLTMVLGGLWHGASWNFVVWGAYHGLLLILFRLAGVNKLNLESFSFGYMVRIISFFHVTCFGWLLFRASSMDEVVQIMTACQNIIFHLPGGWWRLGFALPVILMQVLQYRYSDLLAIFRLWWPVRALIYVLMYLLMISIGEWGYGEFIYFQF